MKKAINQSTLISLLNTISIILIGLSVVAFFFVYSSNRTLDEIHEERYQLSISAFDFLDSSAYLTSEVRAFSNTGKMAHHRNYWAEMNNVNGRQEAVDELLSYNLSQEEIDIINEMFAASEDMVVAEQKAMEYAALHDFQSALDIVYGDEYTTKLNRVRELYDTFIQTMEERSQERITAQIHNVTIPTVIMTICLFLVAAVQVISTQLIRKKIIRPISKVRDEMLELAQGNLSNDFSMEPDTSEIGMLIASILEIRKTLQQYIWDIAKKLNAMSEEDFSTRVTIDYVGEFSQIKNSINEVAEILEKQHLADKRSRAELEDAYQMANAANQSKSDFLSHMSHDIRTPMNAIIGMTTIAQVNQDNPEKVKDCLRRIALSSSHLLGLINDVLDMSAIESGKLVINNDNTSLPEIMENVVNIVQPLIKAKKQNFIIRLIDVVHEKLYCDALRLNQVFINIISNAVKYTPFQGTITLEIKELPKEKDGFGEFEFVFTDTGIGMKPAFISQIFSAFSRDKGNTVNQIEGTGLGMAITKNIIDVLEGTIDVQSELGKGSIFTVGLSLELPQTQDENMQVPGTNILVVMDDDIAGTQTVRLLDAMSSKGVWAKSGPEAIEAINVAHTNQKDFDLIILDWQMPGMNGIETTKEIRMLPHGTMPILLTSAYDQTQSEQEALDAGINNFLTKPLFKSSLYKVIHRYVLHDSDQGSLGTVTEETFDFSGKRLLLVDDIEINRMIASEILEPTNIEIIEAETGEDALKIIENSSENFFDMILMDIQMPGINGYEATIQIRKLARKDTKIMPIIAMTANSFSADVKQALDSGMNSHIAKPIDTTRLMRELEKYLNTQK